MQECRYSSEFAARLREGRRGLADRWIERIGARWPENPPTPEVAQLLPTLIDGIAQSLECPTEPVGPDSEVVRHASEIATLQHAVGFAADEILEQYGLLGGVLFDSLARSVHERAKPCDIDQLLECSYALFDAWRRVETATTTHFLHLGYRRVAEREDRLRAFNRAVSHEIRSRIGTVLSAGELLSEPEIPAERRLHLADIVRRNGQEMRATVDNLLVLARVEHDPREHRHVRFSSVLREVLQQVTAAAEAAGVELRIPEQLPDVEVNEAVRLLLVNYFSNAIKYRDPAVAKSCMEVEASVERGPAGVTELVVRTRDNGLGVPPEHRTLLFTRFFRAHRDGAVHGSGLGLSIVHDVVAAIGGRAWAEFPEKGSLFAFAVPCRISGPAPQPAIRERRESRASRANVR